MSSTFPECENEEIDGLLDQIDALQELVIQKAALLDVSLVDIHRATWSIRIQGFKVSGSGINPKLLSDRSVIGISVTAIEDEPIADDAEPDDSEVKTLDECKRFNLFFPDQLIKINERGESSAHYFFITLGENGPVVEEKINVANIKFSHPFGSGLERFAFTTMSYLRQKRKDRRDTPT